QMSFEDTGRRFIRCQTANSDRDQTEASPNQVFETHQVQKMGGIDFHYPAQRLIQLYGSVSFQALRPCVAAYKTRELGTIVRPATSTCGRPVPATTQSDEPFARLRTPQSFAT